MRNISGGLKDRAESVRIRTWSLTLVLVIALIFYFLVQVTWADTINWIDFILLSAVTILVHYTYYPDGKLFGEKDEGFKQNRDAYNEKASIVNENKLVGELREYCKVDFETRKQQYVDNVLGSIGITHNEFKIFASYSESDIRHLKKYEFEERETDGASKILYFSRQKRRKLAALLFKELPVEENTVDTIMSAVANNGYSKIKDKSVSFEKMAHFRKLFIALVWGCISAYIGYTLKDGFSLATIVKITTFLASIFSNAVMSYTNGEKCIRVHKNRFYIELANFLDGFFEWNAKQPKVVERDDPTPVSIKLVETKQEETILEKGIGDIKDNINAVINGDMPTKN